MKLFPTRVLIFLLVLLVLVPTLLARGFNWSMPIPPTAAKGGALTIRVWLPIEKKTVEMDLEAYVQGVVAGEMPATFEVEALKAQAVAARTYAVRHMRRFGGRGLNQEGTDQADVAADPATNQNYVTLEQLAAKEGQDVARRYWERVRQAVAATQGQIVLYHGAPIEAVYHSTDAGKTEDAGAVWSGSYPYLQSVASDDQDSPRYSSTLTLPVAELATRLGLNPLTLKASTKQPLIQVTERTASGRAAKVKVGDKTFLATDLRRLLGTEFRSTLFTWKQNGDQVEFDIAGSGHGVGMSQWGANSLARAGKSYPDILAHYYTGVELGRIFQE